MFFESAFNGKNQWWRYLVMVIAAIGAANIIGGIPIFIAVAISAARNPSMLGNESESITDLSQFGLDSNLALVLIVFSFIIGLLTIGLLIGPLNGRSFKSLINGTGSVRWSRFFLSFFIWALLMAGYLFFNLKYDPDNYTINNLSRSLVVLAGISLLLIPLQTTFEEVLFRGYLMQGFGVAFRNKWMPLLITSLLFGLMHGLNPEIKSFGFLTMMPQYITFGLVFGLITILDDGIELAMGAHAAHNAFLSVFITQKSSTLQTEALYEQHSVSPWLEYLCLIILSLVFIVILNLVYKWRFRESFSLKV